MYQNQIYAICFNTCHSKIFILKYKMFGILMTDYDTKLNNVLIPFPTKKHNQDKVKT